MDHVASLESDPLSESKYLEWKDDSGAVTVIPAIDSRWLEELECGVYNVLTSTDELMVEAWCHNVENMIETCSRLLNMPSHIFWSHMQHDSEVEKMIDTYLEKCPRYCDPETMRIMFFEHSSRVVCQLQRTLHTLVFRVVVRIATPRPPHEAELDSNFHGAALMTGLMDVARFTDVCCVYGLDNNNLLTRMGQSLVNNVHGFESDMLHFCQATAHVFEGIEREISKAEVLRRGVKNSQRAPLNRSDLFDLSAALSDAAFTIHVLLHILPFAATAFVQSGVTAKLPYFLKNSWKILLDEVDQQEGTQGGFSTELKEVRQRLKLFEAKSLQIFRSCIVNGCFSVLQDSQSSQAEKDMAFDSFQNCITACCDNQAFAQRYCSKFSLEEDMKTVASTGFYVDPSQVQYLNEAIMQAVGMSSAGNMYSEMLQQQQQSAPAPSKPSKQRQAKDYKSFENVIREISDILPEENPAFLQAMLARFDGDSEAVINSILTSSVPYDLQNIRVYGLPDVTNSMASMTLQACAANTFGDLSAGPGPSMPTADGFVPIDEGKKHWQFDVDDRTALKDEKLQHIFDKFRFEIDDDDLVEGGEIVARIGKGNYEDEYDDTYDTLNVGAHDVLSSEDEDKTQVRPPPRQVAGRHREETSKVPLVEGGFSRANREGGCPKNKISPGKNEGGGNKPAASKSGGNVSGNSASSYTGGRQRQLKDRHRQHNRKNAHDAKMNKGMF